MKKLTIRFIRTKNISGKKMYMIQWRKFGFWFNIKYTSGSDAGAVSFDFTNPSKEDLLNKVLKYLHLSKEFVEITEYPTIKKY